MIRAHAPHCPNCAAALRFEAGTTHATCEYCSATLVLEIGRVTHERPSAPAPRRSGAVDQPEPLPRPAASLATRDAPRFSMRLLEQCSAQPGPDLFEAVELDGERFALATLRCIDDDDEPQALDLAPAWGSLLESLQQDGDPGLAVNLALEELGRDPAFRKLECCVVVLDPARTTAQVYSAGRHAAAWWVSTEEGRPITAGTTHQALEKRDLAKRGSHFDNARTIQLAAQDLIVMTSFAVMDDPVVGSNASRAVVETLREYLAEDPQRVVTLAKNAWWEAREGRRDADRPLAGNLVLAAVGARLADPETGGEAQGSLETLETPSYHIALQQEPDDAVDLWPLHDERHALFWLRSPSPLSGEAIAAVRGAIDALLDREGYGDNQNPRRAGREALEALEGHGVQPQQARLLVVHLSDRHRVVKYFSHNWKAGLTVGSRGLKAEHAQQQFDGGGELALQAHARLFFPGELPYAGELLKAEELSKVWFGGKASHLYEALRLSWRTRDGTRALEALLGAAAADAGADETRGLALVSGR